MNRLLTFILGTLWMMSAAGAEDDREKWLTESQFETSQSVVLVRIIESTFPAIADPAHDFRLHRASALVLKSWKGSFSVGSVLRIGSPGVCFGFSCQPYPVQAGDELLVFTQEAQNLIIALQGFVFRAAESKSRMSALDQIVVEQLQLHDPQTDIARAAARQQVLAALRRCLDDSARRQGDTTYHPICFQIDTSVLRGITRSDLVAALGPPTWCQRLDNAAYIRGVGKDCSSEQTPVWSAEPAPKTPGGLMCQSDSSRRCMHLGWFAAAQ